MSPDATPGPTDELDLASVAWQLRTTLSEAGNVPVAPNEDVLTAIRQRSARRRRTKRAVGTGLAAFTLSMTTLAVIAGGRVVTDSGTQLARDIRENQEPPAVTPGGTGRDGVGDSEDPAMPGRPGDTTCAAPANGQPSVCGPTVPTTASGGPAGPAPCTPGGSGGPDCTTIGGARSTDPSAPQSSQGAPTPTTVATPSQPSIRPPRPKPPTTTTSPPAQINCATTADGTAPADPNCLIDAFQQHRGAIIVLSITGVSTTFQVNGNWVFVTAGGSVQQCQSLSLVGAPTWYKTGSCTTIATP